MYPKICENDTNKLQKSLSHKEKNVSIFSGDSRNTTSDSHYENS